MQYANIIINHKAGFHPLTYKIPPAILPHLARGSVVLVPFGTQTVHGVVDQFVRRVDSAIAPKLKPIMSIVYSGYAVDMAKLDGTKLLCNQWGLSQGQTLFRLLPDFPKRSAKTTLPDFISQQSTYQVNEYAIPVSRRLDFILEIFARLRQNNQSLLILCPNQATIHFYLRTHTKVDSPIIIYPENATPKERRDFWLKTMTNLTPTIYIGTRGGLIASSRNLGAIIIDEPWLPGHKDDSSPKLWSVFNANALAKAQKIPLLLVSSLLWPENHLLPIKKTHRQITEFGTIRLAPKRQVSEQLTHWLAETEGLDRAIVVHQTSHETLWCSHCQKISLDPELCQSCHFVPIILPRISVESVKEQLNNIPIEVIPVESLLTLVPKTAVLALNFDAYLSITDWRASLYLGTLLRHFQEKSTETHLATAHPDVWTRLLDKLNTDFVGSELLARQSAHLPPTSLLIRLTANQSEILTKLLPIQLADVLLVGKVHRSADQYAITILLKPNAKLPEAWTRSSLLKLDILPLYLHS